MGMGLEQSAKQLLTSLHCWNVVNGLRCPVIIHSQRITWQNTTPAMTPIYSDKKRCWQIVFVCSTTLRRCIKMLQVLWHKRKQWMWTSGHCGAVWQLCCAASWLWFLAQNAPSGLHRRQTHCPQVNSNTKAGNVLQPKAPSPTRRSRTTKTTN